MPADQITAKDEEKIDTDRAEAIHPAGQFESKKCAVVNDDDHNGNRGEKIEAGLAFAILKARIDFDSPWCVFGRTPINNTSGDWDE